MYDTIWNSTLREFYERRARVRLKIYQEHNPSLKIQGLAKCLKCVVMEGMEENEETREELKSLLEYYTIQDPQDQPKVDAITSAELSNIPKPVSTDTLCRCILCEGVHIASLKWQIWKPLTPIQGKSHTMVTNYLQQLK